MRRRVMSSNKKLFIKRFYPAGNYTWTVPAGCTEVDVFLVGGGGGGAYGAGGGGFTKTFKKDSKGWKDGNEISVTSRQIIQITVGKGGNKGGMNGSAGDGGYSQFVNSNYRVEGGKGPKSSYPVEGESGGSGGAGYNTASGGKDGGSGTNGNLGIGGKGQGHTTRLFGESSGELFASGGNCPGTSTDGSPGVDGTGNGGDGAAWYGGKGGDGIVIIRYWAYSEELI